MHTAFKASATIALAVVVVLTVVLTVGGAAAEPTRLYVPLTVRRSVVTEAPPPPAAPTSAPTSMATRTPIPTPTRLSGPTPTPTPRGVPLEVGQRLRLETYETVRLDALVVGVETRSSIGGPAPYQGAPTPTPVTAGGTFVVALLDVTNAGTQSASVASDAFRLRDSAGRLFDMAGYTVQSAAGREYGRKTVIFDSIQPGFTERMVFVFDVLPTSSGFSLVAQRPW